MSANLPATAGSPGVKGLGGVLVTGRRQRGLGSGSRECPSRFLGCFVIYGQFWGELEEVGIRTDGRERLERSI